MEIPREKTIFPFFGGSMVTIWEEVKGRIKGALPNRTFSLWINPLTYLERDDDTLVLACPNKFSRNWITENYRRVIEEELGKMGSGVSKLSLTVKSPKKEKQEPNIFQDSKQLSLSNMPKPHELRKKWLNQDFTFDRFVVGKCNEFAYSAAKALTLGENWPYNQLYMLANTGLGKSHLTQAIGHAILESNPGLKVFYITAEDFVNQMIFALKNNKIEDFKNKFRRSCDVLLLEEVHFLSGKEKTQLELEYTLDALINDHKTIIFTSPLLPKDIPNLKKGLLSRLNSGIITILNSPDYETRIKILQTKATEQNLSLSDEIIDILARHLKRDIRQMESSLRCLKAKSELLKAKINPDLAREVLRSHVSDQGVTTMSDIQALVCKYFKVDPLLLKSKSRKKIHSYPRNIYVYLCRQHTAMTVQDIGKTINRNHSTVLYAGEVIEHKIKTDVKVKNQIGFLTRKLKELKSDS
jgi:chromosomal replication initiator protein